jgi:Flp pilus assembly pilin Flp
MLRNSPLAPAVDYLRVTFAARLAEARREDRERGASVVEWVVITTIVVVIAVTVGVLITNALTTKGNQIQTCINQAGGTTTGNCQTGG